MNSLKFFGIIIFILVPSILFAGNNNKDEEYVVTTSKGVRLTVDEFKPYYEKYKKRVISEKGKEWYFNLSDKIIAAKELVLQKIILNEAKREKIEETQYFKKYRVEMEEKYQQVEKIAKDEKIPIEIIKLMKERIKNGYLVKAYLNKEIGPYLSVSDDDVDNFLMFHKGKYVLKPDKNNPKARVIHREALVRFIQQEKREEVANQLAKQLFKSYQVKVNSNLLIKIN
ncbi:hypothetical protein DBT_1610 [Dissulfuribacter thermophilus]|uniref:PpiC domain-containing protein n=1 Tax=Dissulfuribacter thermophilus TaxID=1156395 RepID=A0A1B9F5K6_9BACT|nr:hypothetical protein [Dissulfuribacter thermophilus]OCC15124.1 hypothetical protein DBT_1610 [Dissulfuribacter thermophilus]